MISKSVRYYSLFFILPHLPAVRLVGYAGMELEAGYCALTIESAEKLAAATTDVSVQFSGAKVRDAATDPPSRGDADTQTDEAGGALLQLDLASLSFENWEATDAEVDFLRRAAVVMEAALADTDHAFVSELLPTAVHDSDDDVGCIHSATVSFIQPEDIDMGRKGAGTSSSAVSHALLPCAAVSWSCTGSSLAAGFGCDDHTGWCKHRAGVCVYNFYGSTRSGSASPESAAASAVKNSDGGVAAVATASSLGSIGGSAPTAVLETSSCVCSVAWHPEQPSVLAAGTFNGEVLAWDVNRGEDALLARSKSDDYMHREPVCSVVWAWDATTRTHLLLSASSEGKVLVWSLDGGLSYPLQGYLLLAPPVQPKFGTAATEAGNVGGVEGDGSSDDDATGAARNRRRGGGTAVPMSSGIASLSIPLDGRAPSAFYAGAENGGLYKCRLQQAAVHAASAVAQLVKPGTIAGADSTLPWDAAAATAVSRVPLAERSKVTRAIERHARDVGSAVVTLPVMFDARPDPRALFPNPIAFSFLPHSGSVLAIASSPFHRNLFASAGLDGRLCLFSALSVVPLMTLLPADRGGSVHVSGVTSLSWSHVRPMVLAAASGDGTVYIYDLYAMTGRPVLLLRPDGSVLTSTGAALAAAPPMPILALPATNGAGRTSSGSGRAVRTVAFNPKQRRLIASGDSEGFVRVFKLGWRTASPCPSEEALLRRFVDSAGLVEGDAVDAAMAGADSGAGGLEGQLAGEAAAVNSISTFMINLASR
jgi:WD repeat-containing protein 34